MPIVDFSPPNRLFCSKCLKKKLILEYSLQQTLLKFLIERGAHLSAPLEQKGELKKGMKTRSFVLHLTDIPVNNAKKPREQLSSLLQFLHWSEKDCVDPYK